MKTVWVVSYVPAVRSHPQLFERRQAFFGSKRSAEKAQEKAAYECYILDDAGKTVTVATRFGVLIEKRKVRS